MDGTVYSDVPTLSNPDLIGTRVNYFNASKNDFPVGSLVFCQGTMTVLESVSNDPVLSVRATSLLRYYMPPYFFQFSYSSTYSCPGDHTAVDYYEKCPPQNASVSFVGRVIATKTAGGCRFFSVQVTAYFLLLFSWVIFINFHPCRDFHYGSNPARTTTMKSTLISSGVNSTK